MRPNPSPNIRETWSAANQIKEIWPSLFSREKKRIADFLISELNVRPILVGDDRRVYLCDILMYDKHRHPYKEFGVGWGFANKNPRATGQTMEWWCELAGVSPIRIEDRKAPEDTSTNVIPFPKEIRDRRRLSHAEQEARLRKFASMLPFKLRTEFKDATYANGKLYGPKRYIHKSMDGYKMKRYRDSLFQGQAIAEALDATPFIKVTV